MLRFIPRFQIVMSKKRKVLPLHPVLVQSLHTSLEAASQSVKVLTHHQETNLEPQSTKARGTLPPETVK